ncbi:MAG: YcxB family protein [Ferruginibacter sp.]
MVSFKYALTKEDYINYYTYIVWDAPVNKKKRLLYYAKQVLPLLIFLLAFYYTGLFDRNGKFISLIAGALLLTSLLSLLGVRTNMMKQAQKVADNPENRSIFLDMTVIVSEAGITVKDELKETKYQWGSVIKKLESKNYYFLFVNAIQGIIIPKRAFNSTEQKAQFEKILGQYVSFEAELAHMIKD